MTSPQISKFTGGGTTSRSTSPLISCYACSGGFRWHWRQTHDSFPGQPVVLIHGLIMPSLTLVPLAESIASWAPVFLPDLPGYGLSTGTDNTLTVSEFAAAIAEWMTLAGVPSAHIVSCSYGCQIAAELAERFPQRIRTLTLVGPTIDPTARGFKVQARRHLANMAREPASIWLDQLSGSGYSGVKSAFGTIRSVARDHIETKLPRIKVPALVIRGSADPITPESWVRHAAQLLPDAIAVNLPAGAHYVHCSHPGLVSCVIRKFTFPVRNR